MCWFLGSAKDSIHSLRDIDLSNTPMFSEDGSEFSLLVLFLQDWIELEFLDLSYCGLTNESQVKKIMEILNEITTIK